MKLDHGKIFSYSQVQKYVTLFYLVATVSRCQATTYFFIRVYIIKNKFTFNILLMLEHKLAVQYQSICIAVQ